MAKLTRVKLFTHGTAARMQYVGGAHALAPGPLTKVDPFSAGAGTFSIIGTAEASDVVGFPEREAMSWRSKRKDGNYPHNLIHIPIPTITELAITEEKEIAFYNEQRFMPADVRLARVYVYYYLERGIVIENLFVSDGPHVIFDNQTLNAGDIVSATGSPVDRLDPASPRDGETRFWISEPHPSPRYGLNLSLVISCQEDTASIRISSAGAEFWITDPNT